jgi:hypothetical protein
MVHFSGSNTSISVLPLAAAGLDFWFSACKTCSYLVILTLKFLFFLIRSL